MVVYRINECKFINDLSGRGAALFGGRWNSKDVYMVYTSQSRALALLETVVHRGKMPRAGFYCIATIDIPDDNIKSISLEDLPDNWQTSPPPDSLKAIGDQFIKLNRHLALKVPSVLMSDEHNFLINPSHPEFKKVSIVAEKTLMVDERLFPSSPHRA